MGWTYSRSSTAGRYCYIVQTSTTITETTTTTTVTTMRYRAMVVSVMVMMLVLLVASAKVTTVNATSQEQEKICVRRSGTGVLHTAQVIIQSDGTRLVTADAAYTRECGRNDNNNGNLVTNWWRRRRQVADPYLVIERVLLGERKGWVDAQFSPVDDAIIGGKSHSDFLIDNNRGIFAGELKSIIHPRLDRYTFAAQHTPIDWRMELFHGVGLRFTSDNRVFGLGLIVEVPSEDTPPYLHLQPSNPKGADQVFLGEVHKEEEEEKEQPLSDHVLKETLRIGYIHKFQGSSYDTTVFLNWTDFHLIDGGIGQMMDSNGENPPQVDPLQIVGLLFIIEGADNPNNIKSFKLNIDYVSGVTYL